MASIVHSRAYLLIEQELIKFEKNPVKGIRLYPTRAGNLFSLSAKVKGLRDTLWDGAILKLRLRFSESFNYVPPEVNFVTVPFHPNVEAETGRVACPYLDDPQKWNSSVSLGDILASVQGQLAEPNMHLVLNREAADMLLASFDQYKTVVDQCVQMSQIVENSPDQLRAYSPDPEDDGSGVQQRPVEIEYDPDYLTRPKPRPKPSQRKISFETYHADWSRLATSKTTDAEPFNPAAVWHNADTLTAKMESHRRLKYGNSGGGPQQQQQQQQKQEANLVRLDQMRRLYLTQRHASNASTSRSVGDRKAAAAAAGADQRHLHQHNASLSRPFPEQLHENVSEGEEEDHEEADDLVQWTRDLPVDSHTD